MVMPTKPTKQDQSPKALSTSPFCHLHHHWLTLSSLSMIIIIIRSTRSTTMQNLEQNVNHFVRVSCWSANSILWPGQLIWYDQMENVKKVIIFNLRTNHPTIHSVVSFLNISQHQIWSSTFCIFLDFFPGIYTFCICLSCNNLAIFWSTNLKFCIEVYINPLNLDFWYHLPQLLLDVSGCSNILRSYFGPLQTKIWSQYYLCDRDHGVSPKRLSWNSCHVSTHGNWSVTLLEWPWRQPQIQGSCLDTYGSWKKKWRDSMAKDTGAKQRDSLAKVSTDWRWY